MKWSDFSILEKLEEETQGRMTVPVIQEIPIIIKKTEVPFDQKMYICVCKHFRRFHTQVTIGRYVT